MPVLSGLPPSLLMETDASNPFREFSLASNSLTLLYSVLSAGITGAAQTYSFVFTFFS